jgi:small-conductance mechanosensitive channel
MNAQGWLDALAFSLALLAFGLLRLPTTASSFTEALVHTLVSLRAALAAIALALGMALFLRLQPSEALALPGAMVLLSSILGIMAWATIRAFKKAA